jgi:hypothetical protein
MLPALQAPGIIYEGAVKIAPLLELKANMLDCRPQVPWAQSYVRQLQHPFVEARMTGFVEW